jgi:RNA polymerase sigma-70 factor (ECF subfamily)
VQTQTPGHDAAAFIPALRTFFARRVHRDDIDDLIQEVLIKMHGRNTSEIENFDCYLFQVGKNVLRDRCRREQVRRRSDHCELAEQHHPLDEVSPERIVWAREELRHTLAAMGELPERSRKVLVLLRWEGLTYTQVAERLDISVSAVEKHVTRSMRHLMSRLLEKYDPQGEEGKGQSAANGGGLRMAGAAALAGGDARRRACC